MFRLLRKSVLISLLPLVAVAVVWGDAIRMQVNHASMPGSGNPATSPAQDESGLDQTLRAHYVRLNEDNELTGQISAIDQSGVATGVGGLEVNLVQKSRVITRTTTAADGSFLTRSIQPGSYTLCVAGDDGFLAYGVQAIAREAADAEGLPVPLPDGDDSSAEAAPSQPPTNLGRGASPTSRLRLVTWQPGIGWQEDPGDEPIQLTAAVIPPEFSALQRIMADYVPAELDISMGGSGGSRINVEESVVVGGFRVSLTAEGNLQGRIASLTSDEDEPIRLREMNAFLLLDDQIYSRVTVQEDGNFLFNDIEPGVYGFAAAGPDGFAAMSFQAVSAEDEESAAADAGPFRNASRTASRVSDDLKVAITPAEDLPWLRDKVNELNADQLPPVQPVQVDNPQAPPVPPNGSFGGGPGGNYGGPITGGPGNTGVGNIGELVGAGLAAWVLTEAIGNNNNISNTPPIIDPDPMSPIVPLQ